MRCRACHPRPVLSCKPALHSCREVTQATIVRTYWWRSPRKASDLHRDGQAKDWSERFGTTAPQAVGHDTSLKQTSDHSAPSAAEGPATSAAISAELQSASTRPAESAAQPQPGLKRRPRAHLAFLAALKAELRAARQHSAHYTVSDSATRSRLVDCTSWQKAITNEAPPVNPGKLAAPLQPRALAAAASPLRKLRSARRKAVHDSRAPSQARPATPASYAQRPRPLLPGEQWLVCFSALSTPARLSSSVQSRQWLRYGIDA